MFDNLLPTGLEESLAERIRRLEETDYFALSDVTMSSEMSAYRQALRDITTNSNWPNLVADEWPTKPE